MKKIFESWRQFKEVLSVDSSEDEYEKIISSVEKSAGLDPKAQKAAAAAPEKKAVTGTIKSSCKCVDRSESSLSVEKIKSILNSYYKGKPGYQPLTVDNYCDQKTRKTILKFQADTGAEQDGCVGDETEAKMVQAGYSVSSVATTSTGSSSSSNFDPSSVSSGGSTSSGSGIGATITVIKSDVQGPSPHSRVVKSNHQGYGRDTAKGGNTSNDAYFVNGINVADALSGVPGIKIRAGRKSRQFGTELLASALKGAAIAADEVGKQLNRTGGETVLSDVSLGRCFNARQRKKDPTLPCIQGGWGRGLGAHRWGHQSGLEADLSYYKIKGSAQAGWKPTQVGFGNFDFERNCAFLSSLLNHPRMEMVLLSQKVAKKMQAWIGSQSDKIKNEFKIILSSSKIGYDRRTGHDDHYHVRMMLPNDAPNMKQFQASLRNKKNTVSSSNFSTPTLGSRRFKNLASKSLNQIKEIYPNRNQFSYTFGTIDGRIIDQYNQDTLFYGASMPKTMLGLVHLLTFTGDSTLKDSELKNMLVYDKGSNKSNIVARGISSRFSGSTQKLKRRGLGKVTPQQVKSVAKVFGINKSTFQFGGGMNKQTSKESFLFFAGLARMDQNQFNTNDPLERFYKQNKNQIDKLISTQKQRIGSYSKNLTASGVYNRKIKSWGKGGRYNGAQNFVWIIDGKYVISVFSQVRPRAPKGAQRRAIDAEGYDLLNSVIYRLLQKIDPRR